MPRSAAPRTPPRPATQSLVELDLDSIIPSPDNPRERLSGLDGLADSIREQGILEPLVVAPAEGGRYDLVFGHRRHAAAKKAGLTTVPAVIRADLVGLAAEKARLVENLQREDLTPLEEARAYARLIQLGQRQLDVARAVGRNQGHISKRLSLLTLPPQAQAAVTDGRIPVAAAVDLAKLPTAYIDSVLFAVERGSDVASALRRVQATALRDEDRAAAIDSLNLDGVQVVDVTRKPDWSLTFGPYPVSYMPWLDQDEHATLPCAAAVVTHSPVLPDADAGPVGRWATLVCTQPANHPSPDEHDDPETAARKAAAEAVSAERAARTEAASAAARLRRQFCASLVGPRKRIARTAAQEHLQHAAIIEAISADTQPVTAAAFDLAASWVAPALDHPRENLRDELATLTGDQLLRWSLALRLAVDDLCLTHGGGYEHVDAPGPLLRAHLAYLESSGYVAGDLDNELRAALPDFERDRESVLA